MQCISYIYIIYNYIKISIKHLEINQVLAHFSPGSRIILQNSIYNLEYFTQQATPCSDTAVA